MKLRQNVVTALLTAVLCVAAPLTLPLGAVPVSLATLGVYLAAGLLGPWRGAAAVGVYLLLGGVGVPVFAGFTGGFQQLFGVTGGFLWGYLLCAVTVGLLTRVSRRPLLLPLWLALGALVLYASGVTWYLLYTHVTVGGALLVCVPTLLPEGLKIAAATGLILSLQGRLKAFQKGGHRC